MRVNGDDAVIETIKQGSVTASRPRCYTQVTPSFSEMGPVYNKDDDNDLDEGNARFRPCYLRTARPKKETAIHSKEADDAEHSFHLHQKPNWSGRPETFSKAEQGLLRASRPCCHPYSKRRGLSTTWTTTRMTTSETTARLLTNAAPFSAARA